MRAFLPPMVTEQLGMIHSDCMFLEGSIGIDLLSENHQRAESSGRYYFAEYYYTEVSRRAFGIPGTLDHRRVQGWGYSIEEALYVVMLEGSIGDYLWSENHPDLEVLVRPTDFCSLIMR